MKKTQIILTACVWLCLLGIVVFTWKFFISPRMKASQEKVEVQKQQQAVKQTSADPRYSATIYFSADSFSGYSIFRSEQFKNELAAKRIKLEYTEDNYVDRIQKLKSGGIQIAAFPIDALLVACDKIKDTPAVIVSLIDESRGADAILAYKTAVPNLDALNSANMKFVLTPNSPSETLSRVIISHFGLKNLSTNPFIEKTDAEDVYKAYRSSKQTDPQAFVVWEPYVSKMLENPNVHVLVDSSRFRGYVEDALVVNRDYLIKNEGVVTEFVEAYLRTVYHYQQNGMQQLVLEDGVKTNQPLSSKQADRLVAGIWWKNTSENFAHFGLAEPPLQHTEDMISNLIHVLKSTGAISDDPTKGNPNILYYDKILAKLKNNNFHPGFADEAVRKDSGNLPELNEDQWKALILLGTLDVPKIVFARGTSRLTEQSQSVLDELVEKLKSWPHYYVMIRGDASLQGDLEQNKILAKQRAEAAEEYLIQHGLSKTRIKAVAGELTGNTNVSFQMGYLPY